MVQLSTPWGDPLPGNGPPVRRFLSNYFDLLFDVDTDAHCAVAAWLAVWWSGSWQRHADFLLTRDAEPSSAADDWGHRELVQKAQASNSTTRDVSRTGHWLSGWQRTSWQCYVVDGVQTTHSGHIPDIVHRSVCVDRTSATMCWSVDWTLKWRSLRTTKVGSSLNQLISWPRDAILLPHNNDVPDSLFDVRCDVYFVTKIVTRRLGVCLCLFQNTVTRSVFIIIISTSCLPQTVRASHTLLDVLTTGFCYTSRDATPTNRVACLVPDKRNCSSLLRFWWVSTN